MELSDLYPEFATKINTLLANFKTALTSAQSNYFTAKGRYWQGLQTPLVIPTDQNELVVEKTHHPTDQVESWEDVSIVLPASLSIALAVHVYDGPLGHGYMVIGKVKLGEQYWMRSVNMGPEVWRTHKWIVYPIN